MATEIEIEKLQKYIKELSLQMNKIIDNEIKLENRLEKYGIVVNYFQKEDTQAKTDIVERLINC